ncbi:s-methyl-5-thioribose-1-phosphate isomerase [Saccharopolyspora phatthalungensis]|uniref:Methylthioribose-1-phosphate isomerase n=1 Tax=Saccharopolyspora phatthalungensis TaxID=664693 RepID=A0A840QD43_9PSEU|nr:s-methyl-5-thioribose-1-phosphate isomerase [Saccharopolyspora phatthalungensis]MBB5158316.1 methylthioribose-1-phosphate isomerase [Saccharopolyspora phatthalungensis]
MPPPAAHPGLPTLADSVRLAEDGVHLLDRRVFPFERRWVHARTVEEVAGAIEDMVTQSSGPYFAVLWGMVLAAREVADRDPDTARKHLRGAGERLIATRPTNDQPRKAVEWVMAAVAAGGDDVAAAALAGARAGDADYRQRSAAMGRAGAALLPEQPRILTHCWGDLYLVGLVEAALELGKHLSFVCTETRPYLQGARLTAETLAEMGVDTTVVTDGMPASLMRAGQIDALVTASDRVTMDGHVINKVGTLQLAVAAHAFGVPFHALCHAPDPASATGADVPIEFRDGDEVLHTLGRRSASERVRGLYPAFDVTDPRFVTTVVTDRGAFGPDRVHEYWNEEQGTAP